MLSVMLRYELINHEIVFADSVLPRGTKVNDIAGKNCFTQQNGCLAASDLFYMITQSINFYTFHYTY